MAHIYDDVTQLIGNTPLVRIRKLFTSKATVLANLVKVRYAVSSDEKKGLKEAITRVLTELGVPLGIKVSRRETSANLGLALALAMGYYFLTIAVGWLDKHPELRPDLLMWLPNLVFLGVGVWLFWRIDRH